MQMILFSAFRVKIFIKLANDWQLYKNNNEFLNSQQRVKRLTAIQK